MERRKRLVKMKKGKMVWMDNMVDGLETVVYMGDYPIPKPFTIDMNNPELNGLLWWHYFLVDRIWNIDDRGVPIEFISPDDFVFAHAAKYYYGVYYFDIVLNASLNVLDWILKKFMKEK